jgi:hypothetical protein
LDFTKNHQFKNSFIFRTKSSAALFLPESQVNYLTKQLLITPYSFSISLEDSYSVAVNIPNCSPAQPPSLPSPAPCSPYSPLSSFSTFHPLGQDRTSPEGSSCGEAEQGREESEREEDKRPKEAEYTDCNLTRDKGDKESLYAKVCYFFKKTKT